MRLVSYTRILPFHPDVPPAPIVEQNEHIAKYAKQCGMRVLKQYSDRKNDPKADTAFMQLLEDGIHRCFDAVILDSVFYAGRSLGQAREVLLLTFFPAGIHFIVVEDEFSSFGKTKEEVAMYLWRKDGGLKNRLMNNHLAQRNLEGKCNISDVKFGFCLTEDGQLKVDPSTAPIVQEIFRSFVAGRSQTEIARSLQDQKIPVPSIARGEKRNMQDPFRWGGKVISSILRNPIYTGCWTKTVKGQTITFHNEPLINQELFEKAVSRMKAEPKKNCPKKRDGLYMGLLYDSRFGFCTQRRKAADGKLYYYYRMEMEDCERKNRLFETDLENAVRARLKQEQQKADRILQRIHAEGETVRVQEIGKWKGRFLEQMQMIVESERARMETYKAFRAGTVSEAEWNSVQEQANQLVLGLEPIFSECKDVITELEKTEYSENLWLKQFLQYDDSKPLSRELIKRYVQRIYISRMEITSIELNLQEHYQKLPEIWRNEYGT